MGCASGAGLLQTVATQFAVDWLKQEHTKPWCLMLGHKARTVLHGGAEV